MPPGDKPILQPSILAALGLLAGCELGPCLDYAITKDTTDTGATDRDADTDADSDADTDSDTDADSDTDTDADTDTGTTYGPCLDYAPTETGTDTGTTYGPCLDYPPPDTGADTGGTPVDTGEPTPDEPPPSPSRASVFERVEASGVLPADVLERLKKKGL